MFPRRMIRLFSLLAYLLASLLTTTTSGETKGPEETYDIGMCLYRASDEVERAIPPLAARFATITVPPGIGSIRELLVNSHIYPDSGSMGLMYALNPDLGDSLQSGMKVRVIEIPVMPETRKALSEGFLFKIYYDETIIRNLISSREEVRRLTGAVSALAPERFANSILRQTTLDCISSISVDFGHIADSLEDRGQPTNHEMLSQVRGDVEFLFRTLGGIAAKDGVVTAADNGTICSVANDLKIKKEGFEKARRDTTTFLRWPEVRVLVNTFDPATHSPVSMLRIHYAPEALQNDPTQVKQFPALSSPTESQLPEADYVFWVTRDGDGSVLSDRVHVSVRKTQDPKPLRVDIVAKP